MDSCCLDSNDGDDGDDDDSGNDADFWCIVLSVRDDSFASSSDIHIIPSLVSFRLCSDDNGDDDDESTSSFPFSFHNGHTTGSPPEVEGQDIDIDTSDDDEDDDDAIGGEDDVASS